MALVSNFLSVWSIILKGFVFIYYYLEALYDYFKVLLAGFAGSPHLISATILAIGSVMYEFKGKSFSFNL